MPVVVDIRKKVFVSPDKSKLYKWVFKKTVAARKQLSALVLKAKLFWDATHPRNQIYFQSDNADINNLIGKPTEPPTTLAEIERKYTSYSGVDVRVTIDGKHHAPAQAISWVEYKNGTIEGQMISLILDKALPVNLGKALEVKAQNEYGKSAVLVEIEDIEWACQYGGVSIDDLVYETTHVFTGKVKKNEDQTPVCE